MGRFFSHDSPAKLGNIGEMQISFIYAPNEAAKRTEGSEEGEK